MKHDPYSLLVVGLEIHAGDPSETTSAVLLYVAPSTVLRDRYERDFRRAQAQRGGNHVMR